MKLADKNLSQQKKSLGCKLIRELKRAFSRKFWDRLRTKAVFRGRSPLFAGGALPTPTSAPVAAETVRFTSLRDVQNDRAKVACLAGAVKPVVMIIDDRWAGADGGSGALDAINMVRSFIDFGYHVVFGVESGHAGDPKHFQLLSNLGAHPLISDDANTIRNFIEEYGIHVKLFVLNNIHDADRMFDLIRYHFPDVKIIFNAGKLHYIKQADSARLSGRAGDMERANATRDREEYVAGHSDLTLLASPVEEEVLQASVPGCNTLVLPRVRAIRHPDTLFARRAGVGFVGDFEHETNVDALRYFLSEVWQKVHATNPSIRFEITGSALPENALDNVVGDVRYLGSPDALETWLDGLRMMVAPLRIEAGTKGELAASLCSGLPCVISSVAAEGLDLIDGEHVLIGNTPAELAELIVKLHDDPITWERLSRGALEFAEARFSSAHYARTLQRGIVGLELPAFSASGA